MSSLLFRTKDSQPPVPLILIFSIRERIRDILSVGLLQCHYRIIQANVSNIASLKANQFAPDLIIADITPNNTKDILMFNRLQQSERTKKIPLLAIIPVGIKEKFERIIGAKCNSSGCLEEKQLYLIEYPFNFSLLLERVNAILNLTGKKIPQSKKGKTEEFSVQERIEETLFDIKISPETKLREINRILQKQWIFPYTIVRALDILGSETSCCNELANCIRTDSSASAAILKVVNTVQYAKRHNRVTDIKEAVVRLGFQETRNLLSCFALIDVSPEIYTDTGFTRPEFWMHSLCVALIAAKICTDMQFRRPELAFMAGLLHDLGKIPMDNNFRSLFPKLLETTTSKITMFYKIEKRLMGFSHADLGHFLTTEWNFPSSITNAILNHHNPERIKQITPLVDKILNESIFVANQIAKAMNLGHSCDEVIQEIPQEMLNDLHIPRGPSDRFLTSVIRKLNQMAQYLNISIRKLTLSQPAPENSAGVILVNHGTHPEFNPLGMALRHNGYSVKTAPKMPNTIEASTRVIISLPEPGNPLDIVLYDDDQNQPDDSRILTIYITDVSPEEASVSGLTDDNTVFINQENLDIRYVIHILDKFFGRIITPLYEDIDIKEDDGEIPAPSPPSPSS